MKKVGILTTFRQPNWGSVLQAYALQQVINDLGYDSELIDYKYPNKFHWKRGKKWGKPAPKTLRNTLKELKDKILIFLGLRSAPMMDLLNSFIDREMKVSKPILSYDELHANPPIYDIYVSGSDQIWNPNTMLGDLSYMFDFAPLNSKKISYASSFSCKSIPSKLKKQYEESLSDFCALSVRENNGKDIIKELLGRDAKVVLDPTLLITRVYWNAIADKASNVKLPKQYILCYMLSYTFEVDKPMGQLLQLVQDKCKMPVIALNKIPNSFHGDIVNLPKSYNRGIEEFLYLIKESSIIVSSSFHGTAFALNFGKPLVAMGARNEDDRVLSLLSNMNMTRHFVYSDNISSANIEVYYDESKEQSILHSLRTDSLSFLKDSLE